MAYKMSAAARDAYAAMDAYINYMKMHIRPPRRVYITEKQHDAICKHLTRIEQEKLKGAPAVTEFKEYNGCEVVIYNAYRSG